MQIFKKNITIVLFTVPLAIIFFVLNSFCAFANDTKEYGIYKVSESRTINNPINSDGLTTWDCIWFGNYLQLGDGYGGFRKDSIKWRVLSTDGNTALLLSDKNIETGQAFNEDSTDNSWDRCTMRSWLNGYGRNFNDRQTSYESSNFINKAFKSSERAVMKNVSVVTNNITTSDKVFLLSEDDVKTKIYGFSDSIDESSTRTTKNTAYIKKKYVNLADGDTMWWLRSKGERKPFVAMVGTDGSILSQDGEVRYSTSGIRPAIKIELDNQLWRYAGTVNSYGQESEPYRSSSNINAPNTINLVYSKTAKKLNATSETPLSYRHLDSNILKITSSGEMITMNPGSARLVVSAAGNLNKKSATKCITATVGLAKTSLTGKVYKSKKKKKLKKVKCSWKSVYGAQKYKVIANGKTLWPKSNKIAIKFRKPAKTLQLKISAYRKVKYKIYYGPVYSVTIK